MKAICSICTELFTSDSEVSAAPCGHTFHEECLFNWFKESKTCPQCRKKVVLKSVINKLFFTEDDSLNEEADVNKLRNELTNLRVNLREKDREKGQLVENTEGLQKRIKGLEETVSSVKSLCQQEKSKNETLRRELGYAKKVQAEVKEAREEAAKLREQLKGLKNVQDFVNGMIPDIEQRARNTTVEDLAKWCVIQEKELRRKKNECHKLQDDQRTRTRELARFKHLANEKTSQLQSTQERLKSSEEDVASLESQNTSLKRKLEALQRSFNSPSGVEASLAHRLINESPMPSLPQKRPRLSLPDNDQSETVDLDSTTEILSSKSKKRHASKENCKEFGTKFVKITSAAATATGCSSLPKAKSASDISNLPGLGNLNILRKTIHQGSMMAQETSSIKRGYNGLGGHELFVRPQGRPFVQATKPKAKKTATASVFKPSLSKPPPFPSLGSFN